MHSTSHTPRTQHGTTLTARSFRDAHHKTSIPALLIEMALAIGQHLPITMRSIWAERVEEAIAPGVDLSTVAPRLLLRLITRCRESTRADTAVDDATRDAVLSALDELAPVLKQWAHDDTDAARRDTSTAHQAMVLGQLAITARVLTEGRVSKVSRATGRRLTRPERDAHQAAEYTLIADELIAELLASDMPLTATP